MDIKSTRFLSKLGLVPRLAHHDLIGRAISGQLLFRWNDAIVEEGNTMEPLPVHSNLSDVAPFTIDVPL